MGMHGVQASVLADCVTAIALGRPLGHGSCVCSRNRYGMHGLQPARWGAAQLLPRCSGTVGVAHDRQCLALCKV